jgi:hypothetical protein
VAAGLNFSSAVVAALARLEPTRRTGRLFDALALDVHPLHGWLNLSLHEQTEPTPVTSQHGILLADWRLGQFACAHAPESEPTAWPEGRLVAEAFKLRLEAASPETDAQVVAFHREVLEACDDPAFHSALTEVLTLAPGFRVLTQSFHDHDWFLALRWVGDRWSREHWRVERW